MLEEFIIIQLSKSHHQEESPFTLDPLPHLLGRSHSLLTLTLEAKPLTGQLESIHFLPSKCIHCLTTEQGQTMLCSLSQALAGGIVV